MFAAGLFNLCDRLGLDYSKEDVAATGDIYVSKYELKQPPLT